MLTFKGIINIVLSFCFVFISISSKAQGSSTIAEPTLELPPMPSNIKVTTVSVNQNSKTIRFEVMEDLPPATLTRIAANGWQWQFTGNLILEQNVILDSGTTNIMGMIDCKKFKITISNNRIQSLCDNVKVCYTSLIGNGPYQSTFSSDLNFKRIPVPTHILVKALEPSSEGFRRFRYAAPDSMPVETDSTLQTTGWQWSFIGNLSQSMIIDSGNYNSKQIVVKIISNDAESVSDTVKLAYSTICGIGRYTSTKFTRTTGHKYIFDNHTNDGFGRDGNGNWQNGFTEFWDNSNNWNEYPGTHLVYGDTVVIKDNNLNNVNAPLKFEYGSVFIIKENSISNINAVITSNGILNVDPDAHLNFKIYNCLIGNYTIVNNGYLDFWGTPNYGTVINNFITTALGDNYGTIVNNTPDFFNNSELTFSYYNNFNIDPTFELSNNYGIVINNSPNLWLWGENFGTFKNYSNFLTMYSLNKGVFENYGNLTMEMFNNSSIGTLINNKKINAFSYGNSGKVINNDTLLILNSYFLNDNSLVNNNVIFTEGAPLFNSSKLINHGKIINGAIYNDAAGEIINEHDGIITGYGSIINGASFFNNGYINCPYVANCNIFKNTNSGVIDVLGQFTSSENYSYVTGLELTENRGVINNYGYFFEYNGEDGVDGLFVENYGTINNYADYYPYFMKNYGILNNYSVINFTNYYPITPNRIINNYSTINNYGSFKGTGHIININGINNNYGIVSPSGPLLRVNNQVGSFTFSDFTGTPTFEIEIADTNSITGHDFVTVNDTLNAGGTINLSISYIPNPNDEITIMHADTVLNQFDTVNIPAGWSVLYNHPNKGDISVKYDKTNLNVKAFLEGFYNGNNTMNALLYNVGLSEDATAVDSIEVQMWSPDYLNLSEPTFSAKTIIHKDGNANLSLPINMMGNNYYICIKHKNSIETWSSSPILINTINIYDFTSSIEKAYSNNFDNPMKSMPDGNFALYSGDINQDGTIDIFDMMNAENDAINFNFGNISSDCNGDGAADIFDMQLIESNAGLIIFYASPR